MKDSTIEDIGKYTFWLFFLLGNICLFGYVFTKNDVFVGGGLTLLVLGTIINLLIVTAILIYGIALKSKLDICLKSVGIMLINIPIAIVYAIIGMNI
ncbi:hypothetical protein ATE47_14270 [Chryseobacterium sp. IHB B 17019]|jgi:LIVCS family branched-chain amino acid:cation transporter|uniref:hypothetical protein n=1 Tax=Chryseobacterium sp. IHB B 17019 TaxID=1721091 RepID=UPI00071FF29D|nr:hypothetical protein [Chryseobacterium sp. IHB B 17019]ALR31599.1 hypothetical protein ATE47_14270 [Chryseobacterium sp. IHB B 17019]